MSADAEVTYCDDYEAITGKNIPTAETKVITAPEQPAPASQTVAETKAPDVAVAENVEPVVPLPPAAQGA